jgi:uncharacterized protein (TIGR02266 family)
VDNRQHARFPLEVQVALKSKHNFYTGTSKDLSEGGLFVAIDPPPPIGTEVGFKLILGGETFLFVGTVIWHRAAGPDPKKPAGCGIKWLTLEDGALEAIRRFVEVRASEIVKG